MRIRIWQSYLTWACAQEIDKSRGQSVLGSFPQGPTSMEKPHTNAHKHTHTHTQRRTDAHLHKKKRRTPQVPTVSCKTWTPKLTACRYPPSCVLCCSFVLLLICHRPKCCNTIQEILSSVAPIVFCFQTNRSFPTPLLHLSVLFSDRARYRTPHCDATACEASRLETP